MKRIFLGISLLLMALLVGCSVPGFSQATPAGDNGGGASIPTLPEADQTQVALLLTNMPTSTTQPDQPTATEALPTLTPVSNQVEPTSTALPTEMAPQPTATEAPPTETSLPPTEAATATVATTPAPSATATQTPVPSFTAPASDPRSHLGAPSSTDPMNDATTWVWPTGSDPFSSGSFSNGHLVLTSLDELDGWRLSNPRGSDFSSLYLEGTFNTGICAGSDHYGLIARVPVLREADKGYLFGITCDGKYSLRRWDGTIGTKGQMDWLVRWAASSAIAKGSNQTNRLGMMMVGDRLILYVNGVLLTEVKDGTFASGYFGVFVGSDVTQNLSVQVDEMSYWLNPQP